MPPSSSASADDSVEEENAHSGSESTEHEPVEARRKWKGKGKAIMEESELENDDQTDPALAEEEVDDDDDWQRFEPPELLAEMPNIASEVLIRVAQQSIENIKAQVAEEREARRQIEERKREEAHRLLEEAKAKGKTIEMLPIILKEDRSEDQLSVDGANASLAPATKTGNAASEGESSSTSQMRIAPRKYRIGLLEKFLLRREDGGESNSTAPSPRSKLRRRDRAQTGPGEPSARERIAHLYGIIPANDPSSRVAHYKHTLGKMLKTSYPALTANSGAVGPSTVAGRPATPSSAPAPAGQAVECVSCYDEVAAREAIPLACGHSYCAGCFEQLITTALASEARWPPRCCLGAVPPATITRHISAQLRRTYAARAAELDTPVDRRVYCAAPGCAAFIPWDSPLVDRAAAVAACPRAPRRHRTCLRCRNEAHPAAGPGPGCPQDTALAQANELAEAEGWRRCVDCGVLVEHADACQHMTCSLCRAQFCYVCGARWHTCACTMDDLRRLKAAAAARRAGRDAAARELAGMLAEIEAFERAEAERAERERAERERAAAAERAREVRRRVEAEVARREGVTGRFGGLRAEMGEMHAVVRALLAEGHERDAEAARAADGEEREALAAEIGAGRTELRVATTARIKERGDELEVEYRARLEAQESLVKEYEGRLRGYWAGKRRGEEKTQSAMALFRAKLQAGSRAWQKWRDEEVEKHRWEVEEEHGIKEEIMDEKLRRMRLTIAKRESERNKSNKADVKWFVLVSVERERLLAEMEIAEMENAGDTEIWATVLAEASDEPADDDEEESSYRIPGSFD